MNFEIIKINNGYLIKYSLSGNIIEKGIKDFWYCKKLEDIEYFITDKINYFLRINK